MKITAAALAALVSANFSWGTAMAGEAPTLDLNLSCPGQYQDTETSEASVGRTGDTKAHATVETQVMRPGTAQITLRGETGELVYPDGRRRQLSNVTADDRRITADYVRKALVLKFTWRMEINRLTGDVRVLNGGDVGFLGTCSVAPTTAKF